MMVKKIKFATILSSLLFIIMLFTFFPIANLSSSATEINDVAVDAQGVFSIDVFNREGTKIINENYYNFNDGNAKIFLWKDVKEFQFNIDFSSYTPTTKPDEPSYDIKINIDYLRGYKEASWDSSSRYTFTNIERYSQSLRGENSYLNLASFPAFNVDEGITALTTTNITASAKEWGIYQFTLLNNGRAIATSDYIIIEPTRDIYTRPETKMEVTSSETSLRDAYKFSLVNEEEYRYIDSSKLIWYAKGQTPDGTTYAFSKGDLTIPEFSNCDDGLYEEGSKTRTGLNFIFEDDGKFGKWEIWCVYQADDSSHLLKSDRTKIETKLEKSYSYIIWIVVALSVVAIGVTIGISIYKTKREKVY